jgi:2-C-methyl-D-erythritol 4-phosphate cytidylyltransferase
MVQTPQVFKKELIMDAYTQAKDKGIQATDDAALVEALGHPVEVVMGSYKNIKITTPDDLILARAILDEIGVR